jgi:hypothetical protein
VAGEVGVDQRTALRGQVTLECDSVAGDSDPGVSAAESKRMKMRGRGREPGHGSRTGLCHLNQTIGNGKPPVTLEIEAQVDADSGGANTCPVLGSAGYAIVDDDISPVDPGDVPTRDRDLAAAAARERCVPEDDRPTVPRDVAHDDPQPFLLAIKLQIRGHTAVECERAADAR